MIRSRVNLTSRFFSILILLALVQGCSRSDKPAGPSETATAGSFELVADEALKPAIDSLVIGFLSENPRAKVTVKYKPAGRAVEALLNQDTRLIIVSRFLSKLERDLLKQHNLVLPEFDIAQDAIGVVVNKSNPLNSISMASLRKIIRNEAKSWSEIDAVTGEIKRILPDYSSSIETVLDSLFLGPNEVQPGTLTRFQTTDSVLARVAECKECIGFAGSSWLVDSSKLNVKVLPVIPEGPEGEMGKPILLHLAYIYQGLYPLTTRVNGYTFESPNSLPRGFLAYAMNAQGQTVFKKYNVLPRTQIIKVVPSR